jgi:glycosyltransferase involved in cell wall biosynthesis
MQPRLLIISPDFPPARGGVADHTLRLAQEFSTRLPVAVLTSAGNASGGAVQPCAVHAEIKDWTDAENLERTIDARAPAAVVLWQYVPHMYGRGGVNPALAAVMRRLHERGRRQIVIAHEIAAPLSAVPHHFWYVLNHRRQWRAILESADAIGISSEAWLVEWSQRAPNAAKKFFLLPSPATIPVANVSATHAVDWRREQNLPENSRVLAYFGTLGANKQFDWVLVAWEAAQTPTRPVALVIAGGEARVAVPEHLRALLRSPGYLAADAVSCLLHAADVLALPFIDGVSERRTSFMAGLSHGCAVVTTLGHNTGPTLRTADFFCVVRRDRSRGVCRAREVVARGRCGIATPAHRHETRLRGTLRLAARDRVARTRPPELSAA